MLAANAGNASARIAKFSNATGEIACKAYASLSQTMEPWPQIPSILDNAVTAVVVTNGHCRGRTPAWRRWWLWL